MTVAKFALALTVAASALAGCSAGGTPTACDLLTAEGASAATGVQLGEGVPPAQSEPDGTSTCSWSAADTGAPIVTLVMTTARDADQARADYEAGGTATVDYDAAGLDNGYALLNGVVIGGEVDGTLLEVLVFTGGQGDGATRSSAVLEVAAAELRAATAATS